jgi:hypothetical protein
MDLWKTLLGFGHATGAVALIGTAGVYFNTGIIPEKALYVAAASILSLTTFTLRFHVKKSDKLGEILNG